AHEFVHPESFHGVKKLGNVLVRQVVNGDHGLSVASDRLDVLAMKEIRANLPQLCGKGQGEPDDRVFGDRRESEAAVVLESFQCERMSMEESVRIFAWICAQPGDQLPVICLIAPTLSDQTVHGNCDSHQL